MNKARKKFILLTELVMVLLLSALLTTINVISFARAAEDADMVTQRIALKHGSFEERPPEDTPTTATGAAAEGQREKQKPFRINGGVARMDPDSEEMRSSLRYFTVVLYDKEHESSELVEYKISAVSEDEAITWAESLKGGSETGWTNLNYRYRIYKDNGRTLVTVIDQSRELIPSYRILMISVSGGVVLIHLSIPILILIGKRLFRPLEEADRKQKQFIARLENEFRMPLTIINADTETLERSAGKNEQTSSIDKQVRRMTGLVKELGTLTVFEEPPVKTRTELSQLMTAMLENSRRSFEEKGLELSFDIEPDISVMINDDSMHRVISELTANALSFAESKAGFTLRRHKDRIKLTAYNDTKLPDGGCDEIFDRFTTLENAKETGGAGLGLAYVKDVVRSADGRVSAEVKNGTITIVCDL